MTGSCALVGIRTPNLLIRSQVLYPIELRMRIFVQGSQVLYPINGGRAPGTNALP